MKTFNTFIAERFVNALPSDKELKRKWSDDVWSLLQKSYEKIGGIKKGIISLLKKGGPTEIFSDVITSKKMG